MGEHLITSQELAEFLQLHPKTVERQAREGRIPAIRVGFGTERARYRFRLSAVMEALECRDGSGKGAQ